MKLVTIFLLFVMLLFTISFLTYYRTYSKPVNRYINQRNENPTLENNGYILRKKVFSEEDVNGLLNNCLSGDYATIKRQLLSSNKLKNLISTTLPEGYVIQDYIWIIQRSMVHTCHRDNNGDFFNEGQRNPSYTMLIYLEDMNKCLSVLPVSHKHKNSYFFNFTTPLTDILCERGDVILFNANLIHVGAFNDRDDNIRIQMKVSHRDDIKVLSYYQNFNKVLNQKNNVPELIRKAQRSLSCTFPGISNLTQSENIKSSRGSDNGAQVGWFQKIFSYLFYGKSDFYDLPNAF
jgi:hypothetical protein